MAYYVKRDGQDVDITTLIQPVDALRQHHSLDTGYLLGGEPFISGSTYSPQYHCWQGDPNVMINGAGNEYAISGSYTPNLGFCQNGYYPVCALGGDTFFNTTYPATHAKVRVLGNYSINDTLGHYKLLRIKKESSTSWSVAEDDEVYVIFPNPDFRWNEIGSFDMSVTGKVIMLGVTAPGGPGNPPTEDGCGGVGGSSGCSAFVAINFDKIEVKESIYILIPPVPTVGTDALSDGDTNTLVQDLFSVAISEKQNGINEHLEFTSWLRLPSGLQWSTLIKYPYIDQEPANLDYIQLFMPWKVKSITGKYDYRYTTNGFIGSSLTGSGDARHWKSGKSFTSQTFHYGTSTVESPVHYQLCPGESPNRLNSVQIMPALPLADDSKTNGGSGGSTYFGFGGNGATSSSPPGGSYRVFKHSDGSITSSSDYAAENDANIWLRVGGGGGGGNATANSNATGWVGAAGYPGAVFIWGW